MQTRFCFHLPYAASATSLRDEIKRAGVMPLDLWEKVAFAGHRRTLTVSVLAPAAVAGLEEAAPALGMWLRDRFGAFVPWRDQSEQVAALVSGAPRHFALSALVLAKGGKAGWTTVDEESVARARAEAIVSKGLAEFAAAWGVALPADIASVVEGGKTMPIVIPVSQSQSAAKVLHVKALVGARVTLEVGGANGRSGYLDLKGAWHVGPLAGAGMGVMRVMPSGSGAVARELMQRAASIGPGAYVPVSLDAQLEALL